MRSWTKEVTERIQQFRQVLTHSNERISKKCTDIVNGDEKETSVRNPCKILSLDCWEHSKILIALKIWQHSLLKGGVIIYAHDLWGIIYNAF